MSMFQRSISPKKQWRALLVYNFYRLLSLGVLLGIYLYNIFPYDYSLIFISTLSLYLLTAVSAFYLWKRKILSFDNQVLVLGIVDVLALSIMLILLNNQQFGYGILLNVTIAALSIIAPGRLAIFFASLASCLLLTGNILFFLYGNTKNLSFIYYNGIYGAGFFATAITAWYLSKLVRASETLAQHRSEELAAMQRINEYIVNRLNSGIVYVDEGGGIRLLNAVAQDLFGIEPEKIPTTLTELSPKLAEQHSLFLMDHKGRDWIGQATIQEPYLRLHFFSAVISNKTAALIILEDMSFIAQQALQLKLASLGRFSASIAHELRNPLGVIAHAAQLLGEDGSLNKQDKRLKQLIRNNCDRMNRVIKNVLQLSRQEKSQPQINEISAFLKAFKTHFDHNNLCELTVKLPAKKLYVTFDKSQLEQVLINLCDNAIQHGRDALGQVKIHISLKNQGNKVIITISDTGPGISQHDVDSIFEPFFTTLEQGTGMGLFISRDLCQVNGAQLQLVKSEQGCSFSITLNASDEMIV